MLVGRLIITLEKQQDIAFMIPNIFHRHPIGVLVNARKKSGWHGSLTLPLDRGDDKERQTNRIQAQCTRTALQSHSAAFSL
jgi:hypothetical protein